MQTKPTCSPAAALTKTKLSPLGRLRRSVTKRLPVMLAALGLAVWGTAVANANDLYNGYLDILGAVGANGQNNPGPDGWVINATKTLSGTFTDGADSETFCNVQQPGGYGVFFKPFQGQTNANPSLDDELSVYFYQDNPSAPNTKYTFSGYAACEAEFCELFPAPPSAPPPTTFFFVEFLDGGGSVISSNTFDLLSNGLPSGGTGSMALLTTPQYTAPAGTVTVRAGAAMLNAYGTTGAQSFFVDAFDLESVAPAGSPVITNQPVAVTVKVGGTAQFSVGVSNTAGAGITWTRNNVPLSDSAGHISGSSTATLTVTGVTTNDVAHYSAVVTNSVGIAHSVSVPLAITGVALEPAIIITGIVGDTYEVDYTTSLTPPVTWTPLFAAVKITTSPQPVVDTSGIGSGRFYRAVFLH